MEKDIQPSTDKKEHALNRGVMQSIRSDIRGHDLLSSIELRRAKVSAVIQ